MNASNGMFWYAVDKIKTLDLEMVKCVIMIKPDLSHLVKREFPSVRVCEASRFMSLVNILGDKIKIGTQLRVVTFTSHPIPFLDNQTVAFYDDYSFLSRLGYLKKILFLIAARTSKCRIGIINRSLALPFLRKCGIPENRIFFDSAFPTVEVRNIVMRPATPAAIIRIGLVGTDSKKKDYESIFQAATTLGLSEDLRFLIYGFENDYTRMLRREFPEIRSEVVSSDTVNMPDFFNEIDYLVSASLSEGYGRPMGLAVSLGVPLFLLRSPVFLEFFSDHARFFDGVVEMLQVIVETRPPASAAVSGDLSIAMTRSPFFE